MLGAAALCAGSVSASPSRGRMPVRPNVVVLMTDDQTVESMRVMPNVKRLLADRGATFENSFVSFSLCCPSRATFLTGQYAHNHGVLSNVAPYGGYEAFDGSNTLPAWLQRAGYSTVLLGKYLNQYGLRNPREIPPGWTEWYASVDPSTYDYYGYTLNENGRLVRYGRDPAAYQTDVYARKAVEIIRRRAAAASPFFLWVAFLAPHAGGPSRHDRPPDTPLPAPRHLGRFASKPLPRPPAFNETDVSDKPGGVRGRPLLDAARIANVTERYRLRLESLLAVDEAVARIVKALEQSGELDDTVIIFTSDNGYLLGEHRIPTGKVAVYEPSTRVPLVMRGPGIRSGLRLRQAVANVDLAPTIVESAQAKAGRAMDGESLWPILEDPGIYWGRDLLHEGPGGAPSVLQFTALRTPRWLYAKYFSGAEELYDLATDPDELTNLRADPAAAAVRDELRARLSTLRECAGIACRSGPELRVDVAIAGSCPDSQATLDVDGADAAQLERVTFLVGGKVIAVDRATPFELMRPLQGVAAKVRAHAVLADGRELTEDRVVPACPTG